MSGASLDEPIIGRQAELAAIDEFLRRLSSGLAYMAIQGEAGAGKTTIWQEAIRRARGTRITVLACHPAAAETRMPFAALGDLLEPVADEALRYLLGPQRHALEVALLRAASDWSPPSQRAIGVAVVSLLRHLAASSTVLLAVDDAQWLDAPTTGVLEFAARRLLAEPIGVLFTLRLTAEPTVTLDRAAVEDRRTTLRLRPMSMGALHQLLSLRLGRVFPRSTLVKITQASGGNPFYALEIAHELVRVGEVPAGAPLPVPDDLRKLVTARIRRLPAPTRQALGDCRGPFASQHCLHRQHGTRSSRASAGHSRRK